ncbi:MAG: TatD family hydrolase [Actinomycetota bacterium]
MWVDSHCHIHSEPDADALIARAHDAGVEWMVCVGTDLVTSRDALEVSTRHDTVYATVGLHPHDASKFDAEWDALETLARGHDCVGIGETGFDLYYERSPRAQQERAFRAQIRLAAECNKPLVVHSRDAWEDTFRVLLDEGVPASTVFHCFTGGPDEAARALELGCLLSFSGIVSFKSADDLRAAARRCPDDRLLIETDSPYLAPEPHRGTRNEPARVAFVGAAVAVARGQEPVIVAQTTRANAVRVFGV